MAAQSGNGKTKKALSFLLLIVVSNFSTVGSEKPPKDCVCMPLKTFCKVPTSKLAYYATAAACLVPLGLVAASAPLLAFAGFTAGGIAGGSFGAWLMSLYGGNVAAGSLVAILQSWGAAGVGASVWTAAGGMVATCAAIFFPNLYKKYRADCKSDDFVCFFNDDYTGTGGYPPGDAGDKGGDSSGGAKGGDLSGGAKGGDLSGGAKGGDSSVGAKGVDSTGGAKGGDSSGGAKGGDSSGGAEGGHSPKKMSDMYPEGKRVSRAELYGTPLRDECEIQLGPDGDDKDPSKPGKKDDSIPAKPGNGDKDPSKTESSTGAVAGNSG